MKYKDWVLQWLEDQIKPTAKERTYRKYVREAETYLLPRFGERELSELTALDLQTFSGRLARAELASNTVNGVISLLKCSLKSAYRLGLAEHDCTGAIVRPKTREKRVVCFELREQAVIEEYVLKSGSGKLFGIVLSLYTGLRIGELLALKWEDIDLKRGMLTVSHSCHDSWRQGRYVKVMEPTKTANSERVIPLARGLVMRLKKLKREARCEYVVSGRSEYGAQIRSYQRTFTLLLKRLGIAHKGFHALRHTFATRALGCGMDVKTLSEILGHADPTVTLRRYAHSMLDYKREMLNKLGRNLPQ